MNYGEATNGEFRVFIQRDMRRQTDDIFVTHKTINSKFGCFKFKKVPVEVLGEVSPVFEKNNEEVIETKHFLQAIVDAAYDYGIHPSTDKYDVPAQGKHLEDMRKLVFSLLKIE